MIPPNTIDSEAQAKSFSTEVLACGKDGEPEPIQKLQDLVNK
jgi:hypothetical protein